MDTVLKSIKNFSRYDFGRLQLLIHYTAESDSRPSAFDIDWDVNKNIKL